MTPGRAGGGEGATEGTGAAGGVFDTILSSIRDNGTYFVFPSETTASLWARKICLHGEIRSLALERFCAWDRFKEDTITAQDKSRKPASSLIRRLFALALARRNAEAPFLKAVIPADYAENGAVFADSIAMCLSSLGRWEELRDAAGRGRGEAGEDDEDRDLRIIKGNYAAFLEENGLFEPAWEKARFNSGGKRFIVFFPEALEDFAEYAAALDSPAVTVYSTEEFTRCLPEKPVLQFFDSAWQEIRTAVLELRSLHEAGLPYEDAALTLPDYKKIAPYVERELALHDIPFCRRMGKGLGEYPLGRLFSLIGECASSFFSFDALKRLLLDTAIPWKEPEKNRRLVDYGVRNHCAAPFRDRSRIVDAWEESFKQNPNEELAAYYGGLKKSLAALAGSKSFLEIRERYYSFRSFLDMEKCGEESDAVLARCVEELSVLIETEEDFPGLAASAPYDFYVSHLKETNYVYARNEGGVNLYDYPVAAGAPFGCHFLLNVSQAAAAVQHKPLPFLRQDKRSRLGITDTDSSPAILSLYNVASWKDYACHTRISASEKTFTGWAIPHSFFALNQKARGGENPQADEENGGSGLDLYAAERKWRAHDSPGVDCAEKPPRLYSIQREGFKRWSAVLLDTQSAEVPASASPSAGASALLRERIRGKNASAVDDPASAVPELSVSATDLNEFFRCPLLWLYRRIFRLEQHEEDASLLDDASRGLIYHEILSRLFGRVKETGGCFMEKNLASYFSWIEEITGSVLRSDNTLRRPLVYPLVSSLAAAMNRKLRFLLVAEAKYFDGLEVKELEQSYNMPRGRLRLTGRIDRVSQGPSGDTLIIDYKTGKAPSAKQCRWNEEDGLKDFQIPMYIKLYENTAGAAVSRAFFFSINKHHIVPVMGEFNGKEFSREKYQSSMDALEEAIERFDLSVSSLDFKPERISYKTCSSCEFKTICRFLYSLHPRQELLNSKVQYEKDGDNDEGEYVF